jgi:hypothetical protein
MADLLTRLEAAIREDRLLAFVSDLEGQVHEARAELDAERLVSFVLRGENADVRRIIARATEEGGKMLAAHKIELATADGLLRECLNGYNEALAEKIRKYLDR